MSEIAAAQLIAVKARLRDLYEEAEIELWLEAKHPQLNGETAIGLIRMGRADEVHRVLDRLDDAVYL